MQQRVTVSSGNAGGGSAAEMSLSSGNAGTELAGAGLGVSPGPYDARL